MVNRLAISTRQVVKGNHTPKTSAFVMACLAYSFVTIPSIPGVFIRLQLYLISAQVAIISQALTQGDTFLKSAINLVAKVPRLIDDDALSRATEPLLINYVKHFLSSLFDVPDHPHHGVVYILKGLMNALQEYSWYGVCIAGWFS
jgi:hypothetical protein